MNTSAEEKPAHRLGNRVFRVPRIETWRDTLPSVPKPKIGGMSTMVLVYGFIIIIALGALLLILPVSSRTGQFTSPVDALFTATSAVCVTGLVIFDTATYWSPFGQGVILVLIQIGGLGFMVSTTLLLLVLVRKIGLRERFLIGESMGLSKLGGMVNLVRKIALFTLVAEVCGAMLLYLRFSTQYTSGTALWKAVFTSVSAFNNAGFDIFGDFKSLIDYQTDYLVILVIAALIFLGGLSFLVVADVGKVRGLSRLSLDSKLVLSATAFLLILGTMVFLATEFSDPGTMGSLSLPDKILNAFFQSVTARTAGFATVNMANVADYALFFTMILMFIGGAAGSTAGGIKVNTFAMIIAVMWSAVRGREYAGAFGREFTTQQVYRVLTLVGLSLGLLAVIVFLLTITESLGFIQLLFETVSAFGTVGLTAGITPALSIAGRLIIVVTMFLGRVGILALALSLLQRQRTSTYRYPKEIIRIG